MQNDHWSHQKEIFTRLPLGKFLFTQQSLTNYLQTIKSKGGSLTLSSTTKLILIPNFQTIHIISKTLAKRDQNNRNERFNFFF